MTPRGHGEDGAALILALTFLTLIGVATAVLASLAFGTQQAARVSGDSGRSVNALDSGVQAAIENARVRSPFGCGGAAPLEPPGLVNGLRVTVGCAELGAGPPSATAATLQFTAAELGPPACPERQPPTVQATVAFSTIGGTPTGYRIARTTSWKVVPTTCPP